MNEQAERRLTKHFGLSETLARLLVRSGYDTPREIKAASNSDLEALPGIGKVTRQEIREKVG